MLRTSESDETEILLGNKQLLGIFFVVALLLAVAFYGGYMVGRGGSARKANTPAVTPEEAAASPTTSGGETHVVSGGSGTAADQSGKADQDTRSAGSSAHADEPLGSAKHRARAATTPDAEPAGATAGEGFAPQVGQQFLQVAAVSREEAEAVADVLHKKGFRAHAVPKPGNPKIYRVIIGPIRDTSDLSSTRDALMRTGFQEVILQRY
jgi:cell division septation protein DedD